MWVDSRSPEEVSVKYMGKFIVKIGDGGQPEMASNEVDAERGGSSRQVDKRIIDRSASASDGDGECGSRQSIDTVPEMCRVPVGEASAAASSEMDVQEDAQEHAH